MVQLAIEIPILYICIDELNKTIHAAKVELYTMKVDVYHYKTKFM